jgi:hypothetical protein
MTAALLLRLRELRRRGGLLLLAAAAVAVFLLAMRSYGLASDLAVTIGYLAALFCGALPLAIDRERRRSHLSGASPVAPWAWALGSAAGAGAAAAVATFALFAAAGLGAAAKGGVQTHVAYPLNERATIWLSPSRAIGMPPDTTALRTEVRAFYADEEARGAPVAVPLLVDGREMVVPADQPVLLPARPPRLVIENADPAHVVGIAGGRTRALGAERSFLANALLAGLAPALAALGLAALAAAAGANLSAPVAALLAATLLLVSSLKGFLLETWEHEGKVAAAVAGEEHDHHDHEGHGHDHPAARPAPALVQGAMRGLLRIVPDLPALDATDRVARGEWAGTGLGGGARLPRSALFSAFGLLGAATLGGLGVFLRRMP